MDWSMKWVVSISLGAGLALTGSGSFAATMFDAVVLSGDTQALTPDYINNRVINDNTGVYLAPTTLFGAGDLDTNNDHIAERVVTDGQNAAPTDLLHNTNLSIDPAGAESIDYEFGNANTTVNVMGKGVAVSHVTFNTIDNQAVGGPRRFVFDAASRGASYWGDVRRPIIDRIAWNFIDGDTDMQTADEDLTVRFQFQNGANASAGQTNPSFAGTSDPFVILNDRSFTTDVIIATNSEFDKQWRVTGIGLVQALAKGVSMTVVATLSDGSTTTMVYDQNDGEVLFVEGTVGEQEYGEVFLGLDVASENLSITKFSFTLDHDNPALEGFDDVVLILTPVVPEPASVAVWCTVGVVMLIHRRQCR